MQFFEEHELQNLEGCEAGLCCGCSPCLLWEAGCGVQIPLLGWDPACVAWWMAMNIYAFGKDIRVVITESSLMGL